MVIVTAALWVIVGMILYMIELGYVRYAVADEHKNDNADEFDEINFFFAAVLGPVHLVSLVRTLIKHYNLVRNNKG